MFIDITNISHQVRSVIAINMILHTAFPIFMDWMLNYIQTTQEGRKDTEIPVLTLEYQV